MSAIASISRYKAVQVTTSSPGHILVMLFDGVFRFMDEAKEALSSGDRARFGQRISKAHAILEHLAGTLDHSVSPELCTNLEALYLFCMGHLAEANIHRDPAKLDEVARILEPLRDAWRTAAQQVAAAGAAPAPTGTTR